MKPRLHDSLKPTEFDLPIAGSAKAENSRCFSFNLIHPYDPNKIPILFIHGLISSPISWQNLTNDLCSDPEILEHYQPWFFLYPTGQPVLESAAQLRQDLQKTSSHQPRRIRVASALLRIA